MLFENQQQKIQGMDQAMIEHAKHEIAEKSFLPISEVDQTLKAEMRRLEQEARIRKFVPLLAITRTKELLARNPRAPLHAA